jgi:transposase InsO family protein
VLPQPTRSSLHRCFLRHGINRLADLDGHRPTPKKRFKAYPVGYFHIDLTEVRTAGGKLYLFVAVDRTSKFTFAQPVERATRPDAADFLHELIKAVPYRIHTVLTDNGTHFISPGNSCSASAEIKLALLQRGELFRAHAFELACARHDIDHRLTKPNRPWTNGHVEQMNRTIKEATVASPLQRSSPVTGASGRFPQCLQLCQAAQNLGRTYFLSIYLLLLAKGLIRFIRDPLHFSLGLNI